MTTKPLTRYEADSLLRSLAMLSPGAPALDRDKAIPIVQQLRDLLVAEDQRSRGSQG